MDLDVTFASGPRDGIAGGHAAGSVVSLGAAASARWRPDMLRPRTDLEPGREAATRRRRLASALLAAALAAAGCGGEVVAPGRSAGKRVLFVGLDAADWQILDDYMASGAMPNLAALVREGRSGVLETIEPPLSPLVWTSMMTGVGPLEHGILDFTRFHPGTSAKEPITSDERRVPAIWEIASAAGKTVGVFGMWATYPAEAVRGTVVSDRLFSFQNPEHSSSPGVVSPTERAGWAAERLRKVESETGYATLREYLPWLDEEAYRRALQGAEAYGNPTASLRRILIETRTYHGLATDWIAEAHPDLSIVYHQGTDTIGHVFAPFAPPRAPSVSEDDFRRYGGVAERYFREIDRMLGEYRDLARREGAALVIASDHGFYWKEGRPTRLASAAAATAGKWHRKEGIYLLWGAGIAPSAAMSATGGAPQVCATLLELLGLPPGRELAVPSLTGVPPAAGEPADYRARIPRPSPGIDAGREPAPDAEEAIAQLRALGYIGATEPATATGGPPASTRTAGPFNNEGLLLRGQGRVPEARAAFERALTVDPGLAAAQWNLSDLLFREGSDRDRSDALLLEAVVGGVPDGPRFAAARAEAYERAGDLARRQRLLDGAVAAAPTSAPLRLLRGKALLDAERCRESLDEFRRAAALDAGDPLAPASEGLALLCLGDRPGAGRAIRRSLEIDPGQPRLRGFLAENGL